MIRFSKNLSTNLLLTKNERVFNAYKPYCDAISVTNSQGREQTHSVLDKLAKSLRQRNYYNWFRFMRIFFAIRNLMSMKKL